MNIDPKKYEIAYLVNPDVPEDAVIGEAGKITGFIQELHGVVGRIEEPKKQKLAYLIGDSRNAYFGWTTFTIAPEQLIELQKRLKLEKSILRHLIVEETKQPVSEQRPRVSVRPTYTSTRPTLPTGELSEPKPLKEEDQERMKEIDKRLEEILGT